MNGYMRKQNKKRLLIALIIICILFIIGLSVMAGFYDTITQKGFNPLALLIAGYMSSGVGLIVSSVVLGCMDI